VVAVLGPGGEARRVIRAALRDEARFRLVEYPSPERAGGQGRVVDIIFIIGLWFKFAAVA
jgi:hypothetical protein